MKNEVVRTHMSRSLTTARPEMTLAEAHGLMRERRIHHLPVLDSGELVGDVTLRDLYLLETLPDVDANTVTLEEAMSPDPYVVTPTSSLDTVVRAMFKRRLSAAIVVENKEVVGVFTTTDALKALWKLLQDPSRGPSGNKKRGAKKGAAAASPKDPGVTGA